MQAGWCTLRIRRTNKVGNGERKSIWQGIDSSQIHKGTADAHNRRCHVVFRLSAASKDMSDELWTEDVNWEMRLVTCPPQAHIA